MCRWIGHNSIVVLSLGIIIGLLLAGAGWPFGARQPELVVPDFPLHASGGHGTEGVAMATGSLNEDVEGLYTLDFLTGDLNCLAFNPRTGTFTALFSTNVLTDLGG